MALTMCKWDGSNICHGIPLIRPPYPRYPAGPEMIDRKIGLVRRNLGKAEGLFLLPDTLYIPFNIIRKLDLVS